MSVATTDWGSPETDWSSRIMNSMTLSNSLQCHPTPRQWLFWLRGRCLMMTFKQWLKHREQSEQRPTQSANLPALQPCHWNPHRISAWFGWSDERLIRLHLMSGRWISSKVSVFNRSHSRFWDRWRSTTSKIKTTGKSCVVLTVVMALQMRQTSMGLDWVNPYQRQSV